MKTVRLTRQKQTDAGTEGFLSTDGFNCYTLELPWRNNIRQKSCIPEGSYRCQITQSPRFGRVYTVTGVEGRGNILFHSGNYAGDVDKGYKTHVQGCILLGKRTGYLGQQRGILVSRPAVSEFMSRMAGQPFILEISHAGNPDIDSW